MLAIVLLAFEAILPTTYLLWPAAAAILTGFLTLLVGDPFPGFELAFFAVTTVIAILVGPRVLRPTYAASEHPELNRRGARVVGQLGTVLDGFSSGHGKVRLGDTQWLAETDDGSNPAPGTPIKVVAAKGTGLVVREA